MTQPTIALDFAKGAIPESVTVRKPNVFDGVVAELLAAPDESRVFTLPNKTTEDAKAIESALGQFFKAAKHVEKSGRKQIVTDKGVATITIWLVDKITRDRSKSAE